MWWLAGTQKVVGMDFRDVDEYIAPGLSYGRPT